MKVVIISFRRAGEVLTRKWIDCPIVVPESQGDAYRDVEKGEIIVIPNEKDGNCAKKKNAVLDLFPNEDIVILDDDLSAVGYHEGNKMNEVSGEKFLEKCREMFVQMKDIGTVLGGFNVQSDPKFYRSYSPFSTRSIVCAPVTFIRNVDRGIRYSEVMWLKEDYDMFLSVMKKYRKVWRSNKWWYMAGHLNNEGGLLGVRSGVEEERQKELLLKKWGDKIVDIQRKTQGGNETVNAVVRCPIGGI